jgi:hypothetical protein
MEKPQSFYLIPLEESRKPCAVRSGGEKPASVADAGVMVAVSVEAVAVPNHAAVAWFALMWSEMGDQQISIRLRKRYRNLPVMLD